MAFVFNFVNSSSFVTSSSSDALHETAYLTCRHRPRHRSSRHRYARRPACMNASPQDSNDSAQSDQWEQHANRDSALEEEHTIALAFPTRQRHTHVFFQTFSAKPFTAAASRFIDSASRIAPPGSRLWLLRTVADPTFGSLRGEPYPPRCIIISNVQQDDETLSTDIHRWVSSLSRTGPALCPMDSHSVDWAVCTQHFAAPHSEALIHPGCFVAFEILNANWTNARTVPAMREVLDQHAHDVVEAGFASCFEILQSVDSPSCFKTLEVYPSVQQLQQSLEELDEPFATDILQYRAAVNRVRQLHQCIACLSYP